MTRRTAGGADLGGVTVLLGNGTGDFQVGTHYATGERPRALVVADLNGDVKLDIATANYGDQLVSNDGGVSLLFGNGDGTFQDAQPLTGPFLHPRSLAVADFDGDARLDLAVLNDGLRFDVNDNSFLLAGTGATLAVLYGQANGSLGGQEIYNPSDHLVGLAVAEFDGDANPDVAAGQALLPDRPGTLPLVQFEASTYSARDDAGSVTITVTRRGNTIAATSADYVTRDGTATASVSYAATAGTITFAPGQTQQTLTASLLDDQIGNCAGTVRLILSDAVGAGLGLGSSAVLEIAPILPIQGPDIVDIPRRTPAVTRCTSRGPVPTRGPR